MIDGSCCFEEPSQGPGCTAAGGVALLRMATGLSVVLDPVGPEGGIEAESRKKMPSSRYKGVVPQPNGRWGAQIYDRHQRVWLGTFAGEAGAARAYDVAAQRFRGRDAVTNFRRLSQSDDEEAAELGFLTAHSKAEIVDMLRKHTYRDELLQSKRGGYGCGRPEARCFGDRRITKPRDLWSVRERLFDKVVTPSDVGKLNRLVVPKHHAEKHFPLKGSGGGGGIGIGIGMACKGVLLNFEDGGGKVWRFRYSLCSSSQSYVLTKGWSRFVKEKKIKAGDVVSFSRSNGAEKQHLYIDWKSSTGPDDVASCRSVSIGQPPVVKLFGAEISKTTASASGGDRKRGREVLQLFPPQQCLKKQSDIFEERKRGRQDSFC